MAFMNEMNENFNWLWHENGDINQPQGNRGVIRMHKDEATLLSKYCNLINGNSVEIGRSSGGSLYIMATLTPGKVYSIDVRSLESVIKKRFEPPVTDELLNKFSKFSNIVMITHRSEAIRINDTYDLLFIDGSHTFQKVVLDVINYWSNLTTYAIFHDYHTNGVKDVVDMGVECGLFEILETGKTKQGGIKQDSIIVVRKLKEIGEFISLIIARYPEYTLRIEPAKQINTV